MDAVSRPALGPLGGNLVLSGHNFHGANKLSAGARLPHRRHAHKHSMECLGCIFFWLVVRDPPARTSPNRKGALVRWTGGFPFSCGSCSECMKTVGSLGDFGCMSSRGRSLLETDGRILTPHPALNGTPVQCSLNRHLCCERGEGLDGPASAGGKQVGVRIVAVPPLGSPDRAHDLPQRMGGPQHGPSKKRSGSGSGLGGGLSPGGGAPPLLSFAHPLYIASRCCTRCILSEAGWHACCRAPSAAVQTASALARTAAHPPATQKLMRSEMKICENDDSKKQ